MSVPLIRISGYAGPMMIVGDYPTKDEYDKGVGYSGATGIYVNKLFKYNEEDWRKCYSTYVFLYPVPGYDSPKKIIQTRALEKAQSESDYLNILKKDIEDVNPNVIFGMGELALQTLTNFKGISKRRGSIYPINPVLSDKPIKVVCTISARDCYKQNDKPLNYAILDTAKALKLRNYTKEFTPPGVCRIIRSSEELQHWKERFRTSKYLTFDIETHHGFITCISFCGDGYEAISVPLLVGPKWDHFEAGRIYSHIRDILAYPTPKVNQNIKYDKTILENWGFRVNNIIGDTMLLAGCIYPEYPKNLGFLNSLYTDHPYYKDEGREFDPKKHNPDRLLIYNAKDSLVTHQIWEKQLKDAEDLGTKKFYFNNVMPLFDIYCKIDRRGITIDEQQRLKLITKYKPKFEECKQFISLMLGETINPLSPAQVSKAVYDIMHCPKHTKINASGDHVNDTGEDTLEEIYINEITDNGRKLVLKNIILARKLSKVLSFLNTRYSYDGRMRTHTNLAGTETGRTSASKSNDFVYYFDGMGKNRGIKEESVGYSFQTIPKHGFEFGEERIGDDLRTIFVPTPGYTFVEGDQSQAEARVVCVLAKDFETLKLFDTTDIHKVTAALVLGKKFEEITKIERQDYGKKPRHAGNYDMGPHVLSVMSHKTRTECMAILSKFHTASPRIREVFHAEIRHHIDKERCLISPHGRRRDFFGLVDNKMYKEGYSTIPQATISDHNKCTILRGLVNKYPDPICYPIVENHDSNTFEVKNEAVSDFVGDFKEIIKTPINFINCSLSRDFELVIPGEVAIGELSWGEMVDM